MTGILIDSSNAMLILGLSVDHKIVDSVNEAAWQRQSELLIDMLDKMLKKNNVTKDDIDYIVATKGPGSYTGVRIALTVAKVLAFAINKPLYLISSLEVLKSQGKVSLCLSNARSKRSYVGIYSDDKCLLEDTIWTNEEVLEYLKNHAEVTPSGELGYLGMNDSSFNILAVLNCGDQEKYLVKDVMAAKPVYLKDNYPL